MEQRQDGKRAKNTETNNFLRILPTQPDQKDNSLRFARAFARWEASCHLHKTKVEQSQQGQYSSDSESDDVDFQFGFELVVMPVLTVIGFVVFWIGTQLREKA